jgi:glutamate-1-semialdehyde 2,1-aminomutase
MAIEAKDQKLATDETVPMTKDRELQARARVVIPGGMYGHMNTRTLPANYPQFMRSGKGARVVDVDGREFVDLTT